MIHGLVRERPPSNPIRKGSASWAGLSGGFRCNADFGRVLPINAGVATKRACFAPDRRCSCVQAVFPAPHGQLPPDSRRRALLRRWYKGGAGAAPARRRRAVPGRAVTNATEASAARGPRDQRWMLM